MPPKNKKLIEDEKIIHKPSRGKGIVNEKNVFASYNHKCSKCGYDKAEMIDLGAQYSDENELVIVKCGKCGFTERIEKKAS